MVARSIGQRTVLWRSTWHLMQEYPIRGTGLDQLRVDLPRIAEVRSIGAPGPASAKISKRAHNDLFQFAAELGLSALAFLLWTLGLLVGYERRMLHPDTAPEACFLGSTLIIAISGISLNAMFNFPFSTPRLHFYELFSLPGVQLGNQRQSDSRTALRDSRKVVKNDPYRYDIHHF